MKRRVAGKRRPGDSVIAGFAVADDAVRRRDGERRQWGRASGHAG